MLIAVLPTVTRFWNQLGSGRGVLFKTPVKRVGNPDTPILTSTRYGNHSDPGHIAQHHTQRSPDLGTLITQLAEQIGQSITAQLQPESSHSGSRQDTDSVGGLGQNQSADKTLPDVMRSDAKEPPIFRGDGTDKYTVREWETLMTCIPEEEGDSIP